MGLRATLIDVPSGRTVVEEQGAPRALRTGVVGLGHRGAHHSIRLSAFDEYEVVALCDRRPGVLAGAAARLLQETGSRARTYTDFAAMLAAGGLDAVVVAVDPDKQAPLVCEALRAGLDVMVEVPLAYSLADVWRIVQAVEQSGRLCLLMEQTRFWGFVRAWRRIVAAGLIGKPLFAEGEYFDHKQDAFYQDEAGRFYTPAQAARCPAARPAWRQTVPTIGYMPHEISPLLYILDDRVTRVVGMSTRPESYRYPGLQKADIQVALLQTAQDTILRLAVGHSTPSIRRGETATHWYHIKGTDGALEWKRSGWDRPRLFVGGWQTAEAQPMDWSTARVDAPPAARGSGHGDADFYVYAQFADAVLRGVPPELDIYKAAETAAPGIMAARSIAAGNAPQEVPDFRPGPRRRAGELPADAEAPA